MNKLKKIITYILMLSITISNVPNIEVLANDKKYIEIWTVEDLDNVRKNTSANYKLMSDIDLSYYGTDELRNTDVGSDTLNLNNYESSTYNKENGWYPIGDKSNFSGHFDGNGHTISGLWSSPKWEISKNGLFSTISNGGIVENLNIKLDKRGISGIDEVGGIVGTAKNGAIISNCTVTGGEVVARDNKYAGGIVGLASDETRIVDCKVVDTVIKAYSYGGGIVGELDDKSSIENSYSNAEVKVATSYAGGLAGAVNGKSLIKSGYSEGNVSSSQYAGGLVGTLCDNATISESHATGDVTAKNYIAGGLVGEAVSSTIDNTYARGDVFGKTGVGGLVGHFARRNLNTKNSVTNSYSTGVVTGQGTTRYGAFNGRSDVVYKGANFYNSKTASVEQGYGKSGE